jgi:hypothetical protein
MILIPPIHWVPPELQGCSSAWVVAYCLPGQIAASYKYHNGDTAGYGVQGKNAYEGYTNRVPQSAAPEATWPPPSSRLIGTPTGKPSNPSGSLRRIGLFCA